MGAEEQIDIGLRPRDEKDFLDALARIDSEADRLEVVRQVKAIREGKEIDQPDVVGLTLEEQSRRVMIGCAVLMYSNGLLLSGLQQPKATLRRIAEGC